MVFAITKRLDVHGTPRQKAKLSRSVSGPRHLRLAGGHLDDLAALGKAIVLAPHEARRWNAEAYGYATNEYLPRVNGYSDASGDFVNDAVLFLKKE